MTITRRAFLAAISALCALSRKPASGGTVDAAPYLIGERPGETILARQLATEIFPAGIDPLLLIKERTEWAKRLC